MEASSLSPSLLASSIVTQVSVADPSPLPVSRLLQGTWCGLTSYPTDQGHSVTVEVVDRCAGCAFGDLDFSEAAFIQLAGDPGIGRIHGVNWHLN